MRYFYFNRYLLNFALCVLHFALWKKMGKGSAFKVFSKLKLTKKEKADILTALNWQKKSEQWLKDNGQFIPYPATYLNQRRWEDEPQEVFCGDITDPDRYKEDEEDNFDFDIGFMHKK